VINEDVFNEELRRKEQELMELKMKRLEMELAAEKKLLEEAAKVNVSVPDQSCRMLIRFSLQGNATKAVTAQVCISLMFVCDNAMARHQLNVTEYTILGVNVARGGKPPSKASDGSSCTSGLVSSLPTPRRVLLNKVYADALRVVRESRVLMSDTDFNNLIDKTFFGLQFIACTIVFLTNSLKISNDNFNFFTEYEARCLSCKNHVKHAKLKLI